MDNKKKNSSKKDMTEYKEIRKRDGGEEVKRNESRRKDSIRL